LRLILVLTTALILTCAACQNAGQGTVQPPPSVRLQTIPVADQQKYSQVKNMQDWRNPYLIVREDGIALLDVQNSLERILKPEEVSDVLAGLPPSAWPYGRVVAVRSQPNLTAEPAKAAVRRNRGLLAGTLQELGVAIRWVPSA
jgi:hypothetical protein